MTKTIYLTLGASVIASLLLLGAQQKAISDLKSHNHSLRTARTQQTVLTSKDHQRQPQKTKESSQKNLIVRQKLIKQSETVLKKISIESGHLRQDLLATVDAIPMIFEAISVLNIEELFQLFNNRITTQNSSDNDKVITDFIGAILAKSEPLKLLHSNQKNTRQLKRVRSYAIHSLVTQDPVEARKWYAKNLHQFSAKEKEEVERTMCKSLMVTHLGEYLDFLADIPPSNWNGITIGGLDTIQMTPSQRSAFFQNLKKKNSPKLNGHISAAIYRGAVENQNKKLFEEAINDIPLSPEKRLTLFMYAAERAIEFPGANQKQVVQFLKETIPVENSAQIMKQAVTTWAKNDTESAGEWLTTLEPSEARDGAIAGYANTIYSVDPETSMEWLEQISDPARKKNEIQSLISSGPAKNPPIIIKTNTLNN